MHSIHGQARLIAAHACRLPAICASPDLEEIGDLEKYIEKTAIILVCALAEVESSRSTSARLMPVSPLPSP